MSQICTIQNKKAFILLRRDKAKQTQGEKENENGCNKNKRLWPNHLHVVANTLSGSLLDPIEFTALTVSR